MAKRRWKVEWRMQPMSDGLERLGQAVRLAIEHGVLAPSTQPSESDERPRLFMHASADALEEIDQ
jgi:hypothetical protein